MKLYICYGRFSSPRPGGHPCRNAADAVEEAVRLRDRAMSLFLRLRERAWVSAGGELRRYLDALGHYIVGSILWMDAAPRYASPRNRNPMPVPGATWQIRWRDTPADPSTEPPDIRAAAWWWQQLDAA